VTRNLTKWCSQEWVTEERESVTWDGGPCSTKACLTFSSEDPWLYASISFILKPRKLHISLRWSRSTCSANQKEGLLCLFSNGTAYGFTAAAFLLTLVLLIFFRLISGLVSSFVPFTILPSSSRLIFRCSPFLAFCVTFCLHTFLSLHFNFYITIKKSNINIYIIVAYD
jgi:hypothetical protein